MHYVKNYLKKKITDLYSKLHLKVIQKIRDSLSSK